MPLKVLLFSSETFHTCHRLEADEYYTHFCTRETGSTPPETLLSFVCAPRVHLQAPRRPVSEIMPMPMIDSSTNYHNACLSWVRHVSMVAIASSCCNCQLALDRSRKRCRGGGSPSGDSRRLRKSCTRLGFQRRHTNKHRLSRKPWCNSKLTSVPTLGRRRRRRAHPSATNRIRTFKCN